MPAGRIPDTEVRVQRKLTERQQEVLDLIRSHIAEHGYPPTRADIAAALGFRSANAAEEHLRALVQKGAIELRPGTSRGIRIAEDAAPPPGIPLVGRVAAGSPILAAEHIDEHIEMPASSFHPQADYFLRVRGDSMRDAGILDGDLLAVHASPDAGNGDIVVARIDDDVTVKRLQRGPQRNRIRLLPENADFAPIDVDLRTQAFAIEGIAVGVLRRTLH
jgi:repressor LexA